MKSKYFEKAIFLCYSKMECFLEKAKNKIKRVT